MNQTYKTKELEEVLEDVVVAEPSELVVFNDDINTFAHVTETLISVCNHTPVQAEQCTWIIHYKGKCCVKMGEAEKLAPMKRAICDAGIDARIL